MTQEYIIESVRSGEFVARLEVDIQVPSEWPSYFNPPMPPLEYLGEMCPLFANMELPYVSLETICKSMWKIMD